MHFRKSHVRTNKLDVQETDMSFTHSSTKVEISLDAVTTHGWDYRSRSLRFSY